MSTKHLSVIISVHCVHQLLCLCFICCNHVFLLHIDVACCPHHNTETDPGKCKSLSVSGFRLKAGGFIILIWFDLFIVLIECAHLSSACVLVWCCTPEWKCLFSLIINPGDESFSLFLDTWPKSFHSSWKIHCSSAYYDGCFVVTLFFFRGCGFLSRPKAVCQTRVGTKSSISPGLHAGRAVIRHL